MTDVRTGAATPLSMGLTQQRNPSVSPDGSKLAFTAGGPGYDLVEVPLNGAPMRDFLATGSDEYSGAWVPGSSRYVYLTNKNGEEELRIHSQTENWDRLIVAHPHVRRDGDLSAPVASPDGQHVAFDVYGAGGGSSIWISPVGGGAPTRLTPEGVTETGCGVVAGRAVDRLLSRGTRRGWTRDHPRRDERSAANAGHTISRCRFPHGRRMATGSRIGRTRRRAARQPGWRAPACPHRQQRLAGSVRAEWDTAFVWSRDGGSLYSIRRMTTVPCSWSRSTP